MRTAALTLAALLASCSDADLYGIPDPDGPVARAQLAGAVCAPPDDTIDVPYRVLFVIDTSASNSQTDPPMLGGVVDATNGVTRREQAVRKAVGDNLGKPNVAFGIITFSDYPQVQTFGFTNDKDMLTAALTNVGLAAGWTNYSDTLLKVTDFITTDLKSLGPARARHARYLVFWLSDGYPTRGIASSDPTVLSKSLCAGVSYLADAVRGYGAELSFNTAYLGGGAESATSQADAKRLLQDLSATGAGVFSDVAAGEQFSFSFQTAPVRRRFVLSPTLVASNRNVVFGKDGPEVDSDGDGLSDADETAQGLDPTRADTDGDGLSDGVESAVPSQADPRVAGALAAPKDSDGDGLTDAEEALLGTSAILADSDGDYLIDSLEHASGSSALNPAVVDTDRDSVPDDVELKAHLNPRLATSPQDASKWGYKYRVDPLPTDSGPRCYWIQVANVAMLQTAAHGGKKAGTNALDVIVSFEPEDGGAPVIFWRASVEGSFVVPDVLEPANGSFDLSPASFARLP